MNSAPPPEDPAPVAAFPTRAARRNFRRNVFWNYLSGSVSLVSLLVFYPIGVALSSAEKFGLWVLVFGGTQLLSAADFGLGDGVVRTLTGLTSRQTPHERVREFVTVAMSLFAAMGAIVITIYAVALPLYLRVVPTSELDPGEVVFALVAGGVSLLAAVGVRACNAVLWSMDRQDIERKSTTAAVILRAGFYVAVWASGAGFVGVVAADVLASLLPFFVCTKAVHTRFGRPRFTRSAFGEYARPLLRLSVVLFAGSLASMLVLQLPLYIVGAQLGLTAATAFGALMRVYQSVRLVNSWMANPFVHGISTGEGPRLARSAVGAHLLTGTMGLGMAVALAGLGSALMTAWMGPAFAFAGSSMAVISLGALGDALTQPSRLVINLRGRPAWTAVLNNVTLVAVLIACFVTARTGSLFAVMTSVAGIPLLMAPAYLLITRRIIGGSPLPVRRMPALSALVVVVPAALVALLDRLAALVPAWPAVIAGGAVVAGAVLVTLRFVWRAVHAPVPAPPTDRGSHANSPRGKGSRPERRRSRRAHPRRRATAARIAGRGDGDSG